MLYFLLTFSEFVIWILSSAPMSAALSRSPLCTPYARVWCRSLDWLEPEHTEAEAPTPEIEF